MRLGTNIYDRGKPKRSSQSANKSRVKMSSMNKHKKRSYKAYKKLEYEIGNLQVQIAEYQQIIHELSEKLKLYEHKYGSVFKATNQTHNN